MNQIEEVLASGHYKLVESILSDDTDLLLLYLAIVSMKFSGHRYGAFLDAASTAAKLAVYTTYLAQGRNQRKTGFIHHIETKRVKAIVQEVEAALTRSKDLKQLRSREPQYLMGIPHLWIKKFPPQKGTFQPVMGLSQRDKAYISSIWMEDWVKAGIIPETDFLDLIIEIHNTAQNHLPELERPPLSDSMTEHIKFCLLNSGTVVEIKLLDLRYPFFALAKTSYSPKSYSSRIDVMIRDTLSFFKILKSWAQQDETAFRAVESLEIKPENYQAEIAELDQFLMHWANRHHDPDGQSYVLYSAVGPDRSDVL